MQEPNKFFDTARPIKLFFMVALPGLVSMLASSLFQIFEGSFVGHTLGESAFAAVNIAMPIVFINFCLSDLIGVGSSVPISVALGRKDGDKANNVFTCAIILIFITGTLMGLLLYFTSPFLVDIMGAKGRLAELSVKYVRVYAIMSPLTTVVFATDNYLRISGFVKGSMFLNILMSLLTIGFLVLFLGIYKKNIEYSALSSCLSMFICAIIAFIPFIAKKSVLRFVNPRFSVGLITEIGKLGFPTFLNNVAGRLAAIFMNAALISEGDKIISGGGETAVAAYSVLMYASGVIEAMLYGMSDSVQPAIGYNWGSGSLRRVRDITKVSFIVCGALSVLCASVMLLFPEPLARLFIDEVKEPMLMELSVHAMKLFGYSFIVGWFGFAVQGFFAAIEKPLPATIISICRSMVFPIIMIFALSFMGLDGLWLNYGSSSLLSAILCIVLLIITQKNIKRDIQRNTAK